MSTLFAKVENGIVTRVAVVTEDFLRANPARYGNFNLWVMMDVNVVGKFGGEGWTFSNGVFVAPQPYPSWTLDENHDWQPPTPMPTDGKAYKWTEDLQDWVEV